VSLKQPNWLKEVGDKIEADEAVLEIATDKVDSEVPSEVSGVLIEQLFGKTICLVSNYCYNRD
jgi:pyruvate/2-oxoglutarate dehydrogenase complex dihydrolipoamide acyltransferase (E2) component